jgi:tight adherence protein C
MFLLLLAAVCLGSALYFLSEIATAPARERRNLVTRATEYGRVHVNHGRELPKFRDRVVTPFVARASRLMLRVNPKASIEGVTAKLMAAGMRDTSPAGFLAAQAAIGGGGILFGLIIMSSSPGSTGLMFMLVGGVGGFIMPSFFVSSKARRRQNRVSADLPDALDLLAVSVEAGMGFDGAVSKLTEHMHGPLIDEFELALGEMRIGENRSDALKKMADRVAVPEMAAFVRSIVQADQLGISLGRILRVQAADARLKRQAAAEERAMKAPIKMLFPLVLFIFPAMFIVILGPAFLNLGQLFSF